MSMEEFNQMDNQVMDVVNDHAAPEAVLVAESIAAEHTTLRDPEQEINREMARARVREGQRRRKKENILAAIYLLSCIIVAGALLLVLVKPQWLVWVVNIGLAVCCTIAGIVVDRQIRRDCK